MSLFLLSILCASVTNAFAPTSIITELDNVFAPLSNLSALLHYDATLLDPVSLWFLFHIHNIHISLKYFKM